MVRDAEHQQVSITFQVNSGKRARFTLPTVIGDTKLPPADLARAAKYKDIFFFPWKPATQTATQAGLQNIRNQYEKQNRLTASVTLERTDYLCGREQGSPHHSSRWRPEDRDPRRRRKGLQRNPAEVRSRIR